MVVTWWIAACCIVYTEAHQQAVTSVHVMTWSCGIRTQYLPDASMQVTTVAPGQRTLTLKVPVTTIDALQHFETG